MNEYGTQRMTREEQLLHNAKIKKITDLANIIAGSGSAFGWLAFFLPKVDYSKGFWDWSPQLFMVGVGTALSGAVFAFGFNQLQGQGHQKGDDMVAEEKRSAKGSILVAAGISFVLPFFQFEDSTILWVLFALCFVVAIALWRYAKPKKK